MLGAIRRAGNSANANVRHRLLDAFVKPRMFYCLPVWGNCCEMSSNKLDRTLLRALRIITRDAYAKFSKTEYAAYGILPYRSLLKLRNVCLVHRMQHSDGSVVMPNNAFSKSALSGRSPHDSLANILRPVKIRKEANKLFFC